jgi:translocation and assembly module TamB
MRQTRTLAKWSALTLVITISTVLLAVATTLGSERGRLWLARIIVNTLNQSTPLHIRIGDLSAPQLGQWKAQRISVHQGQQLWLVVDKLSLHWQPKALLDRSIIIDQIQAKAFSLHKLAPNHDAIETTKSGEENSHNPLLSVDKITAKIPNIQLKKLTIQSLDLYGFGSAETDKTSLSYAIYANANWLKSSPLYIDIEALGLDAIPATLKLQVQSDDWNHATLAGSLTEAEGGFFGALLQLPKEQAIEAGFDASVIKLTDRYRIDINHLNLPIAQRNLSVQGRIAASVEKNTVLLDKLTLVIDDTHHTINGSWINQQLDVDVSLNTFPLDIVKLWQAAIDNGDLTAQLNIKGSTAQPYAKGSIRANTVYKDLSIAVDFVGSLSKNLVTIESLKATLENLESTLENLKSTLNHSEILAHGKLDLASDTSNLEVFAKELDLTQLDLFGIQLPPTLNATIVSAEAKLHGSAHNLRGNLSATAKGDYAKQPFSLVSHLVKDDTTVFINRAELTVADASASLEGRLQTQTLETNLTLQAKSMPLSFLQLAGITLPDTLDAQLNTQLNLNGNLRNPKISGDAQLQGVYQEIPFTANASGFYHDNDSRLETASVSAFGEQVFTASGHYREGEFDIRAQAKQLPSQLFSAVGWAVQPGDFNADIHAQGSLATPTLTGRLNYESVLHGYDEEGQEKDINFVWNLDVTTNADAIDFASTVTRGNHLPGELVVTIPIQPYIHYAAKQQRSSEFGDLPLQASLKGNFNLQSVSFLLDPDLHRLTGNFDSDINISGTLAKPKLKGTLRVDDAGYENPITGTFIEHIDCALSAEQFMLNIDTCQATDGGADDKKGQYTLAGTVHLPVDGSSGRVALKIKTQGANILRRPDIDSEATGEITLSGDFTALLASGNLEVAPFTAVFDANSSSGIPSITTEEVQSSQKPGGINKKTTPALPVVQFDLVITASNQAYLRGHGLEAELQGKIDIHGDSNKPLYEGEFKTIHGVFELFNKKFKLKYGQVNFANNAIGLAITGIYEKNGQRIQADLAGTNDNITLSLSAIPQIPEDEILAFIIFGKSLQKITPFEAIQLASAVQKLRSGGSGFFDPIGSARDVLGIDTLSIESAATEDGQSGINVGIGKYLNEKVYLELERTPNPSQPWKGNLEIELTPSINLESSTGGRTGIEGAKLKWIRDY